jgi:hypothetical protein
MTNLSGFRFTDDIQGLDEFKSFVFRLVDIRYVKVIDFHETFGLATLFVEEFLLDVRVRIPRREFKSSIFRLRWTLILSVNSLHSLLKELSFDGIVHPNR